MWVNWTGRSGQPAANRSRCLQDLENNTRWGRCCSGDSSRDNGGFSSLSNRPMTSTEDCWFNTSLKWYNLTFFFKKQKFKTVIKCRFLYLSIQRDLAEFMFCVCACVSLEKKADWDDSLKHSYWITVTALYHIYPSLRTGCNYCATRLGIILFLFWLKRELWAEAMKVESNVFFLHV